MTRFESELPRGARIVALDLVLAAWSLLWLVIGFQVADRVQGLTALSNTVVRVGTAITESGRTLQSLESLPLVGNRIDVPSEAIANAGISASRSGRSSREDVEDLSVLLGIAVAVIPSLPLLAFYLPVRISLARERRELGVALMEAGDDPGFRAFLARRALQHAPLQALRGVSERPWLDYEEGRHDRLADVELARFGLLPPPDRELEARREGLRRRAR